MLKYGKLKPFSDGPHFLLFHSKVVCGEGRSSISRQLASGSYRNLKHSHSNKNTSLCWSFLPLRAVTFPRQEPPQPCKTPGSLSLGSEISFCQLEMSSAILLAGNGGMWRQSREYRGPTGIDSGERSDLTKHCICDSNDISTATSLLPNRWIY